MSTSPESLTLALAGRYRVERELGRGGMATVWLAEDLRHHRPVAIKLLPPEVAGAIGPERFLREIAIAARLMHPHILPLHDSGVADGLLYYVTPYVEGETLRHRLVREKQLPVEDALRLAREIGSALASAHGRGIVHRDIKPENILLADGLALVADFGIARVVGGEPGPALTVTGTAIGTLAYMSPEQVTGSGDVDARADIYALGCVLYEMLAGTPPFSGPPESLAHQHLSVEARAVTALRPTVPKLVAAAIAKALAKSPADRFATAARFAEALDAGAMEAGATPAPEAESATPHNLPRERTRFIGRERELAECGTLLDTAHLLTLTGVGGSGKTRCALRLAESLLGRHPDGAWFVDLAPLSERRHVIEAVAGAMGVHEEAGRDLLDLISGHLRGRRVLVVLDNCEHLVPEAGAVADALLRASREVRVIATSREGLGVEGEHVFPLQTLGVPAATDAADLAAAESSDAVRLFVDRATLADPGFRLGPERAAAVVEICRRLDGIPLAIELAAARVKLLSVEQIRARLDDRFRLLTGGSRTGIARHQTLRAAIQWSYDQLAADEQNAFRALTVFAGGWTLESAARVVSEAGDEFEVMELLGRLVDKSLVTVDRMPGRAHRYGMLETVRQYGHERLVESGEAGVTRSRLLGEMLGLAQRAYDGRHAHEDTWGAALEAEHDNLRVALEVAQGTDPERHLELAGLLSWYWQARSHLIEGGSHVTTALAAAPGHPPRPARARALWGASQLAQWTREGANATARMREAIAMWRELGDRQEVAHALHGLGWAHFSAGDDESALASFREGLDLQLALGDPVLVDRAKSGVAQALVALHRVPEARLLSQEFVAAAEARGDRRTAHFGHHFLADCALIEGDCAAAITLYRRSLALARAVKDRVETSFELEGVAMALAGLGESERALRLVAASTAERERLGVDPHVPFWDALNERWLGAARASLDEAARARAAAAGRRLSFEDAVAIALGEKSEAEPA